MFEKFTDRARKVCQLAHQEAQRFNHHWVGTEHLLLGMIKEGSGVASAVLKNLDMSLHSIRGEVEKIVQNGPGYALLARLPYTPPANKVFLYAIEESRSLSHNYVGTEHLLLGLLREKEGVAAQVMTNMGITPEAVRDEVMHLLGHHEVSGVPQASTPKVEQDFPDTYYKSWFAGIRGIVEETQHGFEKEAILKIKKFLSAT